MGNTFVDQCCAQGTVNFDDIENRPQQSRSILLNDLCKQMELKENKEITDYDLSDSDDGMDYDEYFQTHYIKKTNNKSLSVQTKKSHKSHKSHQSYQQSITMSQSITSDVEVTDCEGSEDDDDDDDGSHDIYDGGDQNKVYLNSGNDIQKYGQYSPSEYYINDEYDNKSTDSDDENEYQCTSPLDCVAVRRLVLALDWYQRNGNEHEKVYKKMNHHNYGINLANDYNHIIEHHLNDEKNNENNIEQYSIICKQINKHIKKCTFKPCNGYIRYCRARKGYKGHQPSNKRQSELQVYVNVIDSIHCCFLHMNDEK